MSNSRRTVIPDIVGMKIEIYDVLVLDFGDGISSNFPLVASLVPNSRGLISDANSLIP